MKQNIYDHKLFFDEYNTMRQNKKGTSANDLIEIPTIRSLLPSLTNKKILELGCGFGENCSYFVKNGASYVLGIDISYNMINLAKEKNQNKKIEYKVLAMENIDELKEKYDLVVSSLAIHYVKDFDKLLKDVYDRLNDHGYFIFSQEHPIETATILNAECNEKDNIYIGNKNYFLVSDYNLNGKRIVNWNHCKVIKYHRNFSNIITSIVKSGFQIEEIVEPVPTPKILELKPKYKNQLDRPYFLFIKLKK